MGSPLVDTIVSHWTVQPEPRSVYFSVQGNGGASGTLVIVSEIRWLDDEEQRTWRAFLSATRLLWAQLDRELQADAAMPNSYYAILVLLSEAPERALRMSDLASATQSSPSRMSHAIGRLEKAGWVRRESCPNDRRGWYAKLTNDGLATLEAAAPQHLVSVRAHLFDQLSREQLHQLREISETLVSHLSSLDGVDKECVTAATAVVVPPAEV
jgi:DNA-binding MarR family transcriptional regulator